MNTPLVPQPEPPKPEALRLEQKRAGAKTFFDFGEESLRYGLEVFEYQRLPRHCTNVAGVEKGRGGCRTSAS